MGRDQNGDEPPRERRQAPRTPTDIEVDYGAEDTFLFAHITDISIMGIFIRTETPARVGTRLWLRFAPPENVVSLLTPHHDEPLNLQGEVVWTTGESDHRGNPGMGVKFLDLEPSQRSRLLELVSAIAYLDDSDDKT